MIKSFDHLHYFCKDVEETAKFFESFLGAKITIREEMSGNPVIRMDLQGIMLILAVTTETLPVLEKGLGLNHIGLQVHDLKKTVEKMKEMGGTFTKDYTVVGPPARPDVIKIAFLEGPDGIRIELMER